MISSYAYLLGHLNAWWQPYFFGASPGERQEYTWLFQRTYKVTPPLRNHPVPDAQHMVLGLLVVGLCGCSTVVYFAGR